MGLDQFARATSMEVNESLEEFEDPEDMEEIAYWRKHPNLQGWMENLYWEKEIGKGIKSPFSDKERAFNLVPVVLTKMDLDVLENAVKNGTLPHTSGFFFGYDADKEYKEQDLKFISKAREAISNGKTVYYKAWW